MDNLTQGVIGGSLYTLITGKHTNKNFLLGAGIANIPDLDVFVSRLLPLSPLDAQFFHRGIMHSIIFNIGVALVVGYILYRGDKTVSYWRYFFGVFVSILCGHLLIDGMTSYGMRYWLPFLGKTYSSDNIFVIDFGMRIIIIIGLISYMLSQAKAIIAKRILTIVSIYFIFTFLIQGYITHVFESHYPQRGMSIKVLDSHTFAEPLQPFLRRHLIKTPLGYYESYYSLFDHDQKIDREFVSSDKEGKDLINKLSQFDTSLSKNIRQIQSFSRDMIRVTKDGSGYVLENMIFGPLLGRQTGHQERMFNFYLQPQGSGYILSTQSGSRSGLTKEMRTTSWKRVFGDK